MKKFSILTSVAILGIVLGLAGCANGNTQEGVDTGTLLKNGTHLSVAIVTDTGGINDRSFNQSAWEGLIRANEDFGIAHNYLESQQEADYLASLETLTSRGNDMIFGIGFRTSSAVEEIALEYPEQSYGIVDFVFDPELPNVTNIVFRDHESSYLAGYIAGSMTETNIIGFVGGMEISTIARFEYGFRAGVESANPDAEVIVQYANSFNDQATGRAIATNMYQRGADIVFHAAADTGIGVIEAAVEQDKFVIGVDRDQIDLAPEHILTSTIKEVGNSIYGIVEAMIDGTYESGNTMEFGLFNGGVGIAPSSHMHVPADILDEVNGVVTQEIIAGNRFVPSNAQEFAEFQTSR